MFSQLNARRGCLREQPRADCELHVRTRELAVEGFNLQATKSLSAHAACTHCAMLAL